MTAAAVSKVLGRTNIDCAVPPAVTVVVVMVSGVGTDTGSWILEAAGREGFDICTFRLDTP